MTATTDEFRRVSDKRIGEILRRLNADRKKGFRGWTWLDFARAIEDEIALVNNCVFRGRLTCDGRTLDAATNHPLNIK